MAEPGGLPITGDRRFILVIGAVVAVVFLFLIFTFRSCGIMSQDRGYTTIYSNLELKDAANVVARLKELKIPFEIKDDGRSVAVPKSHSADARLGLAEKNLPTGGSVGWEIFDESKLGATDFDRRIQLIRAISGELQRTIRTIAAIEDCRVQIVIPETRLFEVSRAPVTASVLLRVKLGKKLSKDQINGIVHLVASSVENLKTENVTIVDDYGNILSQPIILNDSIPPAEKSEEIGIISEKDKGILQEVKTQPITLISSEAQIIIKEKPSAEAKLEEIITSEAIRSPIVEDKTSEYFKAKAELERSLSARAQMLVNQFYPPNSIIIQVAADLEDNGISYNGKNKKKTKAVKSKEIKSNALKKIISIKKLTAIVLVDNRLQINSALKNTTYATIKAAIGFDKKRGDKIIFNAVPFHLARTFTDDIQQGINAFEQKEIIKNKGIFFNLLQWIFNFGLLNLVLSAAGIFALVYTSLFVKKHWFQRAKTSAPLYNETSSARTGETVNAIRQAVEQNPERVANLLKKWLTEKKEGNS